MFKHAWDLRLAQVRQGKEALKTDIRNVDLQIDQILDRITESNNLSVINAYEKKIEKLDHQKLVLAEKLQKTGKPKHTFEQMFEHSLQFLANPCKLWDSGDLALRKIVLRLGFSERIPYDRKTKSLNPKKSLPFNILGDLDMQKRKMVGVERLELPTRPL